MSDLHWTGAALLLAVAVLGGGTSRARRDTELSWDEFARANGIARDDTPGVPSRAAVTVAPIARTADDDPYRPVAPAGRTTWLRATASCGHCGRAAGDLEWDAAAPAKRAVLRPSSGGPTTVVPLGARLRCPHCGGPVFTEEAETVVARLPATLPPARGGRPRKGDQRAS